MERHMSNNCITPNGFTPVRRKDRTVNAGRTHNDKEQEWTTARCHRLLRALTSRVAILNKEISRYSSAQQLGDESRTKNQNPPRTKASSEDGDWMHPRKKVKQTYSARGIARTNGERPTYGGRLAHIKDGTRPVVPGEVAVSTPFLVRARGEILAPQQDDSSQIGQLGLPEEKRRRRPRIGYFIGACGSSWQLSRTLREMKSSIDPPRYSAYEGIYAGLEALVRATTKEEPEKTTKGAKSLFSMALRAVPRYISKQEKLLSEYVQETGSKCAITSRDISTEVYDDLECLGYSGKSWKHLRTVVRSHGIHVISNAIQAGLFDIDFCGVLITLLVELSAIEEAESLFSALLDASPFPNPKTIYDSLDRRLQMLAKYAEHTGRTCFQYAQLSKLIVDGKLSTFWLATKGFGHVWTASIQSISSGTFSTMSLFGFLETSLPSLAASATLNESEHRTITATKSSFSTAAENTFASLLTIISSIFILSRETRILGSSQSSGYEAILPLLRSCSHRLRYLVKSTSVQMVLLLMVQVLIESNAESDLSLSDVAGLLQEELIGYENFLDMLTIHENLGSLVSNIARCCGRGASTSGFDYLQQMHSTLETLGCEIAGGNILEAVIVDSAYHFADKNPERQHLEYASSTDKRFASRIIPSKKCQRSEGSNEGMTGFRWEEGISEWVTVTPALSKVRRRIPVPSRRGKERECETPFRAALRRQRDAARRLTMPSPLCEDSGILETRSSDDEATFGIPSDETNFGNPSFERESEDELVADRFFDEATFGIPSETDSSNSSSESESEDELVADRFSDEESISEMEEPLTEVSSSSSGIFDSSSPDAIAHKAPRVSRPASRNNQNRHLRTASTDSVSGKRIEGRHCVDLPPRLGNRRHLLSRDWQVLEESDDELSFISVSSSSIAPVMRDVTNQQSRKSRRQALAKQQKRRAVEMSTDSEDELCI